MRFPFSAKKNHRIDPLDRWYVELDERPVALIVNPAAADMFWFTWDVCEIDDQPIPPDVWDYSNDRRRTFRHAITQERNRCTIPAGKGAVLPDGRVLLRGPLKGQEGAETNTDDEPEKSP